MSPRSTRRAKTAEARSELSRELRAEGLILGVPVAAMWALEIVDAVRFHGGLDRYGIHPRTPSGLVGVLTAPFLHAGFAHLLSNTLPLLVLGFLVLQRGWRTLAKVTAATMLVGGLGVWLFGAAGSVHLGASVLVFGYLGYLLSRGVFERRFWSVLGGVVVFALYGGALYGVLPGQSGVSWEGHLFGLLGGVLAARRLARR